MRTGIVVYLILFGTLTWFGAWCVNYALLHTLHHTLPVVWALLLALVTVDLAIPAALLVKVLVVCGILH